MSRFYFLILINEFNNRNSGTHDFHQNPSRRGRRIFDFGPGAGLLSDSAGNQSSQSAINARSLAAAFAAASGTVTSGLSLGEGGGFSMPETEAAALQMLSGMTPFLNAAGLGGAGIGAGAAGLEAAAFWMLQNTSCPICQAVLPNSDELQHHFEGHLRAAIGANPENVTRRFNDEDEEEEDEDEGMDSDGNEVGVRENGNGSTERKPIVSTAISSEKTVVNVN